MEFKIFPDIIHKPVPKKRVGKRNPHKLPFLVNVQAKRIEPAGKLVVRKFFFKMLAQSCFKHSRAKVRGVTGRRGNTLRRYPTNS